MPGIKFALGENVKQSNWGDQATTKIERVLIQGREVDVSNRQTRLNEKYREKYRQQAVQSGVAPAAK